MLHFRFFHTGPGFDGRHGSLYFGFALGVVVIVGCPSQVSPVAVFLRSPMVARVDRSPLHVADPVLLRPEARLATKSLGG